MGPPLMSQLSPFVRAFRALAKSSGRTARQVKADTEAHSTTDEGRQFGTKLTLAFGYLSEALEHAATDLEQQIAADAARFQRQPVDVTQRESGASD